jgi:hypothetical protein
MKFIRIEEKADSRNRIRGTATRLYPNEGEEGRLTLVRRIDDGEGLQHTTQRAGRFSAGATSAGALRIARQARLAERPILFASWIHRDRPSQLKMRPKTISTPVTTSNSDGTDEGVFGEDFVTAFAHNHADGGEVLPGRRFPATTRANFMGPPNCSHPTPRILTYER